MASWKLTRLFFFCFWSAQSHRRSWKKAWSSDRRVAAKRTRAKEIRLWEHCWYLDPAEPRAYLIRPAGPLSFKCGLVASQAEKFALSRPPKWPRLQKYWQRARKNAQALENHVCQLGSPSSKRAETCADKERQLWVRRHLAWPHHSWACWGAFRTVQTRFQYQAQHGWAAWQYYSWGNASQPSNAISNHFISLLNHH